MNYTSASRCFAVSLRLLLLATSLFVLLAFVSAASAADASRGAVTGSITSSQTRNALQGALVTVPSLNQTTFTDNAGSFTLQNVPPGPVDVVISYAGFAEEKRTLTVRAGETSTLDLAMKPSDGVIMMDSFSVATEREGQALSITEQRNAANIKNVTAFDEWGILPTQNVGELVSRLPGITFTTDDDNLINNVSIRGQPSTYTRLNVDGMSSTGVGGDGRTATLHSFSGSMYEQVEIIAGQTSDKRADSLGGQLNLKTKSPLAISDKRRVNYTLSGRWFPPWSARNDVIAHHALRPDFSVSYTEVFDVGQGRRNLGVTVGASYQQVINPFDWDLLQYENTTNPTAYLRDYDRRSGLNDRYIKAFSARADYKWSRTTTVSFRFIYNAGDEPVFHYTFVNPFLSSAANLGVYNATTNPAGGIMPGYTVNRAEIRPVGNAQMLFNIQKYSFSSKNPTGTLAFEHNWGRLKVDHAYRWSNTHFNSGAGRNRENGQLSMRTRDPIGFVLDNSDLRGRVFTQTAGPSIYDPASFTPFQVTAANTTTVPVATTSVIFTKRDAVTDTNEVAANVNASYLVGTNYNLVLKTGLDTVNRRVNNRNVYPRRWYGVVGTTLTGNALMPLTEFERQHGPQRLPVYDPAAVSTTLGNSALWVEDVNFTATQQKTNRRIMEEGVDAAYIQAQAKVGKLTAVAGVRREWVTTDVFTFFRARTLPIAAEPDHFRRAALDYNQYSKDGDYAKSFPSVHLSYDVTRNFKARASWSNSYGRPLLANLIASPTVSDTARTVTIGNPAIKPQVADNIDLKLEYYYGSSNLVTITGYRKRIKDYIGASGRSGELVEPGENNGFDGLYAGYEYVQPTNVGSAEVKGFEFDFRQRLTFLPGLLKGITARGNYTYLKTQGKFAGTTRLNGNQIAGFIPRAYNIGLNYTYKKFGATYDLNHTSEYPVGYNSASPGSGNIYRFKLTTMSVGFTYKIRPQATLFVNVNNLTEAGPEQYTFIESRTRLLRVAPRSVKFGVTGQF